MKALSSQNSPSRRRKTVIASALVAVLVLGSVGAYAYFARQQKAATPSDTQRDANGIQQNQVKPESTDSQSHLPSKTGDNTVPGNQSSTEAPSTPPEKPTIERAGGDPTIKVVATFQKASEGYCELRLSKSGYETVSYTSNITVGPSYYTCSFSISRASLPAGNPWSVVIVHHIGTASTSSDARDLE